MAGVEVVIVNLNGKARDATLNGRPYKVADATMIVPGVLPGSQGPLLYTPEETAKNPSAWDGVPLLLGHPVENGKHVSGRHPRVWEAQHLGHVFNATVDEAGRLRAEAWFDVERTRQLAPGVLTTLESGSPIELSTGLYLDSEKAPDGAAHNGQAYGHVARNFRPDHLAVLVGEKGACSNRDGCGINVANAEERGLFRRFFEWLKGGAESPADNAWSEAAREAAAEARRAKGGGGKGKEKVNAHQASAQAQGASKAAGGTEQVHQSAQVKARDAAQAAAGGDSRTAAQHHDSASRLHDMAAADAAAKGDEKAEGLHMRAARLHREAAAAHRGGTRNSRGEEVMNKQALVSWLVANCDCWRGEEATLNALSEAKLRALHDEAKKARTVAVLIANSKGKKVPAIVLNAEGDGEVAGVSIADLADLFQITTDPKTDPVGFTKELKTALEGALAKLSMDADPEDQQDQGDDEAVENPDGTPVAMSATPAGNRKKGKPVTVNEWLAGAPREVQSAVRAAMEIEKAERTRLVRQLTANVADDARRKKLWTKFMASPIDELRDLVSLLPAQERQEEPAANYFGAAGVADAPAQTEEDARDFLPVPVINYAELAAGRGK